MAHRRLVWVECEGGWCRLKDVMLEGIGEGLRGLRHLEAGHGLAAPESPLRGAGKHQAADPSAQAQHPGTPHGARGRSPGDVGAGRVQG